MTVPVIYIGIIKGGRGVVNYIVMLILEGGSQSVQMCRTKNKFRGKPLIFL
jgi:hypothetical protein